MGVKKSILEFAQFLSYHHFLWYATFYFFVKLPRLKNLDLPWWKRRSFFPNSNSDYCPSYHFLRVFPCIVNLFIMYRIFLITFLSYFFQFCYSHLFLFITFCAVISPLIFKILFFSYARNWSSNFLTNSLISYFLISDKKENLEKVPPTSILVIFVTPVSN